MRVPGSHDNDNDNTNDNVNSNTNHTNSNNKHNDDDNMTYHITRTYPIETHRRRCLWSELGVGLIAKVDREEKRSLYDCYHYYYSYVL